MEDGKSARLRQKFGEFAFERHISYYVLFVIHTSGNICVFVEIIGKCLTWTFLYN